MSLTVCVASAHIATFRHMVSTSESLQYGLSVTQAFTVAIDGRLLAALLGLCGTAGLRAQSPGLQQVMMSLVILSRYVGKQAKLLLACWRVITARC